jgi:adenosine deaminase
MQKEGLLITIHAGEWSGAANVFEAIADLNADRIGHGVRVLESDDAVSLALERNVPFEVCVTSNVQRGVFSTVKQHAVKKMIDSGLFVTINTDDPGISQITLSDEYQILNREFDLSVERLFFLSNAAIQAAFLPPEQKKDLFETFKLKFRKWQKK